MKVNVSYTVKVKRGRKDCFEKKSRVMEICDKFLDCERITGDGRYFISQVVSITEKLACQGEIIGLEVGADDAAAKQARYEASIMRGFEHMFSRNVGSDRVRSLENAYRKKYGLKYGDVIPFEGRKEIELAFRFGTDIA